MRQLENRWFIEDVASGNGASAAVFKGYDSQKSMRVVAVKLFYGVRSSNPVLQESFQRELRVFSDLRHDNILEFIDWGEDEDGHPFLVLEWLPRDLDAYLKTTDMDGWDDFANIAILILTGLAHIHTRGHLHRDIKPSNILVTDEGIPKITDFGITRLRGSVLYDRVTFIGGGTEPYLPPATMEDGKTPADPEEPLSYHFDRDVYAFSVIVLEALAKRVLSNRAEVETALEEIDPPQPIHDLLRESLALDRTRRPATAGVLLERIQAIQEERESHWLPRIIVPIDITYRVRNIVATFSSMSPADADAFILEDLNESVTISTRPNTRADDSTYRGEDLEVSATAYKYFLRQATDDPSRWAIVNALKTTAHADTSRDRGLRGNYVFRLHQSCPSKTREAADALYDSVASHVQGRIAEERSDASRQLFGLWSAVLHAKKKFEDERGKPIRFKSVNVDGRRVRLDVGSAADEELIGQPRVIRIGEYRSIRGEIEQLSDGWVALYVETGDLQEIPTSGELHYDADAALAALRRQEASLNAVRYARAVRNDLGGLITYPDRVVPPLPVTEISYLTNDLDESKREAVRAAMGLQDIMVVEGPPGTGKTTFIAEVVAQFKRRHPGARILLSSQTHSALDNALERIHELMPELRLVRLGRADRISIEVEHLRIDYQLESWRESVLNSSRAFLQSKAEEWGVTAAQAEVTSLASRIREISVRMSGQRSQLKRESDEKRVAEKKIEEMKSLSSDVLAVAVRIENVLHASDIQLMQQAARSYIDRGFDLASALEGAGGLATVLLDYTERIRLLADLLKVTLEEEKLLKAQLAHSLGTSSDETTKTEVLLREAAEYAVTDERLARLDTIYADWERRFARSNEFAAALIASADLIAATCVGGAFGATNELDYDLCIIDEMSKATPTEALIPMSRSRRWILVGDRQQLPPFQEAALAEPEMRRRLALTEESLAETLLDRIADSLPVGCHFLLKEQHRMVPAIGDLISTCFYKGLLSSSEKQVPDFIPKALGNVLVWRSTSRCANRREMRTSLSKSRSNEAEAYEVRTLMTTLAFYAQGTPVSVLVLAGYADQRDLIKKVLNASARTIVGLSYEVATVDAVQGREADVCIFSLVRSNDSGDLGFLSSRQRINVALSRGRFGLAVIGDARFIETSPIVHNPMSDVLAYMLDHPDSCSVAEACD